MSGRIRTTLGILGFGFGAFVAEALYSGNERFYRERVMPFARWLVSDAEVAHNLALFLASHGLLPHKSQKQFPNIGCRVFGLEFDHPVGLAAGFDKNGEAVLGLLSAGFSHVEVGTVTPQPQLGNPKPRIFRWNSQEAIINRCGFNNHGHDVVYERLKNREWEGLGIVGVNLGCNKSSVDPIADYVKGVEKFGEIADYLVINVSSPNTAVVRTLQVKEKLYELLTKVLDARAKLKKHTPILLKISPDESDAVLKDIVDVALNPKTRVDGLIVTNTTIASHEQSLSCGAAPFPSDNDNHQNNVVWGGLSGRPLFDKSTTCLRKVSALTKNQLPLIGVGGISSSEDAIEKLDAGATLVQLYTSFAYQGPPVAHSIARGINKARVKPF